MNDTLALIAFLVVVLTIGGLFVRHFVRRARRASLERMADPNPQPDLDRHEAWLRAHLADEVSRQTLEKMAAEWRAEDKRRGGGHG
ncbi:hypothetical protein [Nonomuraea typhae]|uniref:Uncharacterized protein n=1 Tax=Nonomuraea typhae TaxID=2603600 RepID=A0ABW7YLZ0_9ACTN